VTQPDDRSANERLEAALARFLKEGFSRREPGLLQPAGVFLDRLGEDFRGRLFLTSDGAGAELCLRPEYTIPVALDYLASGGEEAGAFAYGGPTFRIGEGEAPQAGLESFGRTDLEAADAEILGLALEAATAAGAPPLKLRLGDAGLVKAFLDRLDLGPAWRRRLEAAAHARSGPKHLARLLTPPARENGGAGAGVLAALEKADSAGARKLVEDLLAIAGISSVGGRSAGEIAERFLEQAALAGGLGDEKRSLIAAFFAIDGTPDEAAAALRKLACDAELDLGAALDFFETRASFIAARGLALDDMTFTTDFPHSIDYYSGFMFEARAAFQGEDGLPLLSGGRYDGLLKTLGAARDIPAIGAALWINRFAGDAA
jgi:ATP phosphoribosyltransferase regulatory subunit